ncbi:flagellar basal body P-ring formation chaperone FlgA [Consotaella salsifontis]|uniref:Flagella basal body P-ring formation protein FlgA n=1 Tax=Consotaella salsifontis TaxID=1365950 RepID=A0A1T4NR67_9HYPH|nr:flagellar basal body P-ring formation chaperone FlgA [Consotaella salsifontis]SJZ81719.1 flagella basal body P-ring formation protein FlgA [Consotaella salsifontis]
MSASTVTTDKLRTLSGCIIAAAAVLLLGAVRACAADIDLPVPNAVVYPGQAVLDKVAGARRFRVPGDRLSSYVVEEEMLEGKIARRTLLPNKPILLADLTTPDVVKAGTPSTIVYRDGGLLITMLGVPLRSAAEGETVRVKNADTGVVVAGRVMADGTIEVTP